MVWKLYNQEAQWIPFMQDKHKVNHTKAQHNQTFGENIIKNEGQPEKKHITYRGPKIRMIADFSSKAITAKNPQ